LEDHIEVSTGASGRERRDILLWQSSGYGIRIAWGIVTRTERTGRRDDAKTKSRVGRWWRQRRSLNFCC